MARDTAAMAHALRDYLPDGERITGLRTISAGHSNETYIVEGIGRVLRMPPSEKGLLPPYDMEKQHTILKAVHAWRGGPPVPRVFELCTDPAILGDPFFLMERLNGEAFEYSVPEWLEAGGPVMCERVSSQWINAVIALHRMPVIRMPAVGRSVSGEAQHWLKVAHEAEADAILIEVLEDLASNPPRLSGPSTPVHGDPKHGNCLWDSRGNLLALVDWEMAQVGEPLQDLGYLLSYYDQGENGLADAGLGYEGWWPRAKVIDAWEQRLGRTAVDLDRYEMLGIGKLAAIVALGYHMFRTGEVADPRFQAWGSIVPQFMSRLREYL